MKRLSVAFPLLITVGAITALITFVVSKMTRETLLDVFVWVGIYGAGIFVALIVFVAIDMQIRQFILRHGGIDTT